MGCLEENTALAFVEARLSPESLNAAAAHAQTCTECHSLLAVALVRSRVARVSVTKELGPTSTSGQDAASAPVVSPPALLPGAAVGRFTVLGLVGRGGMGEVYAAYDPSLDRRVALKMMHPGVAALDDQGHGRMLREAQAIAKLSHPNVVVVYEVGTSAGQVFIAMEFVEGRTLSEWLAEGARSWRDILDVYLQAGRGLSAAHQAGFVHRDFKPQNVMVTSDGQVRVMDFGLARRIDDAAELEAGAELPARSPTVVEDRLTRTGDMVGTPLYMAPEQFASGRIDARTDQFSFCVSLFWALFGVHPFGAGPGTSSPAPKDGPAPAWLRGVIMRGLKADPEARWPSIEALATALSHDPARRSKRLILGAAALIVLGSLGVAGARAMDRHRAVCHGGPGRMAGVWELAENAGQAGSRRAAVRAAILRSGASEAPRVWERVSFLLDRHATRWLAAYRDACEATHLRGEQSEEALDLRMECMTDNLDSTRALTELLAGGSRDVVENAVQAAGSLTDFDRCAKVQRLRLGVQPPEDPAIRGEVTELRRRLKAADALLEAGQYPEGTALATRVVERAETLGYRPLLAEALALAGEGNVNRDHAVSIAMLERAIVTAEASGDDRGVAIAATEAVFPYGFGHWSLAERTAELAQAALERIGGDARTEGWLANNIAALRYRQNRLEDALREFERSLAIKKGHLGEDHLDVARTEDNMSLVLAKLGRLEEALALCDRVLRVYRNWVPADSYWLANVQENKANILRRLGRADEAELAANEVVRIVPEAAKAGREALAGAIRTLGLIALARDQPAAAVSHFEHALRVQRAGQQAPFEVAETQFALARSLGQLGRDRDRAVSLASEALKTYATETAYEAQSTEIRRWLALQ